MAVRQIGLRVEHTFKNRTVGTHVLNQDGLTTVGSGRAAAIRLLGDDVSALHAAFDLDQNGWTLRDLGSASGTRVNQKGVVELGLTGATVIHIGGHQLKATPFVLERELFAKDLGPTAGARKYQQVVVLKHGLVVESRLIAPGIKFDDLAAVTTPEWVTTERGRKTIRRRLVASDVVVGTDAREERRAGPVVAAAIAVLMIAGFLKLGHQEAKPTENQFTRMIFDGKKVRQKKLVAEKLRKAMGQPTQTAASNPATAKPPSAKVVSNLKMSGLGALIGRVAARAGKNSKLIESAGVNAEQKGAGRALGLGGGSALDKLGGGVGGTMKVGALGTVGKGGGATGYHGSGGLAQGGAGQAEVGMLEEETEVDGGLDKEAIARVIRSQLGQIRYCYERQLSASPDLYGKILVKFTIGAVGAVTAQAIGNSSLNNAMVEGCILRRVAGWQFPTPKGGTNVMVTYPFLFKSTR